MKELVVSKQTDMFYISSTCMESVSNFPSLFDVCYMIDKKSMLVSSRVPVCIYIEIHVIGICFRDSTG